MAEWCLMTLLGQYSSYWSGGDHHDAMPSGENKKAHCLTTSNVSLMAKPCWKRNSAACRPPRTMAGFWPECFLVMLTMSLCRLVTSLCARVTFIDWSARWRVDDLHRGPKVWQEGCRVNLCESEGRTSTPLSYTIDTDYSCMCRRETH